MHSEQLKIIDVRGWRSRLEAALRTLPTLEPGSAPASEPADGMSDAPASVAFRCLPMLDWPPNLFA